MSLASLVGLAPAITWRGDSITLLITFPFFVEITWCGDSFSFVVLTFYFIFLFLFGRTVLLLVDFTNSFCGTTTDGNEDWIDGTDGIAVGAVSASNGCSKSSGGWTTDGEGDLIDGTDVILVGLSTSTLDTFLDTINEATVGDFFGDVIGGTVSDTNGCSKSFGGWTTDGEDDLINGTDVGTIG